MAIPKIIHYCWFGGNQKPEIANKCINSWKKYCPDYKIIEWNEENFDINACPVYVRQAYEAKKWAFVTDYVRLKVVYDNGGIYLDTDVELKKKLDRLLDNKAYFGFEDGRHIGTGLGFGAEKGLNILLDVMNDYKDISFIKEDGTFDQMPCPKRNTEVFLKYGLVQNDSMQVLNGSIKILPSIYLCPISYYTGKYKHSLKTISIHWFSGSWQSQESKERYLKYKKELIKANRKQKIDYIIHLPNMLMIKILGKERYENMKNSLKR